MHRRVEAELLDHLPADDPQAVRSRRDLHRINALMGNPGHIARQLQEAQLAPKTVVEIGAGDGLLMLRLARRLAPQHGRVELFLVDRQELVTPRTVEQFQALGWCARSVQADVFDWFEKTSAQEFDLIAANLFLHHFHDGALRRLFEKAATRTQCFVACEPRRSALSLFAARLLGLIGCNFVTRHDALVSIRAGFANRELSELWPQSPNWNVREGPAGFASHCFLAQRSERLGGTSPQP